MSRQRSLTWAAVCLAGAVLGWFLIGGWLVSHLQVEHPGSYAYDEYVFMRDASRWFGVFAGAFATALATRSAMRLRRSRVDGDDRRRGG